MNNTFQVTRQGTGTELTLSGIKTGYRIPHDTNNLCDIQHAHKIFCKDHKKKRTENT